MDKVVPDSTSPSQSENVAGLGEAAGVGIPRRFGFWTGAALVAASMIGTGILITPGYTATGVGSHSFGLALWAIGGVLALCGAVTIAEMSTALPCVGGEYVFVDRAWGKRAAFVYGWTTVVLGFAGPTAAVAINAAEYLHQSLEPWLGPASQDSFVPAFVGSFIILAFTVVHCIGPKSSSWVQLLATGFKYCSLVWFACMGILYGIRSGQLLPRLFEGLPAAEAGVAVNGWAWLIAGGAALVYVNYTYIGWNAASYLAGEIREPHKLLPRSLLLGCLSVTLLYFAIVSAFVSAFSVTELQAMSSSEKDVLASLAAARFWPTPYTSTVFAGAIGLGLLATASAFLLSGSRVLVALAERRQAPQFLGRWSKRTHTPLAAVLFMGAGSLALCWPADLPNLLTILGIGLTGLGLLFASSIFILRRRADYHPTFKVPLYPLPPVLYFLACLFILIASAFQSPHNCAVAFGVILTGFLIFEFTSQGVFASCFSPRREHQAGSQQQADE